MRPLWPLFVTGALGVFLQSAALVPLAPLRPAAPSAPTVPLKVRRHLHRTAAEEALWRARWDWTQAQVAVNRERDALLDRDPDAVRVIDEETWRRQLWAQDRGGYLRRARTQARQAAELARTPGEVYHVLVWQALMSCAAGDHVTELRQARRLMKLAPRDRASLLALRRAARCNSASSR